jgi:hypothetical protein
MMVKNVGGNLFPAVIDLYGGMHPAHKKAGRRARLQISIIP